MAQIFISHSSTNNASAVGLRNWLQSNGWDDYFLDFEPKKGIDAGEKWQTALRIANDRCEAVLILLSHAWLKSQWCLAEFHMAQRQGKAIFGLIIETVPRDTIPQELTDEWQLCDLSSGTEREVIVAELDPIVPKTEVSFAHAGLARLKAGLQRAGLDPSNFSWPPPSQPERSPYPGLRPLEVEDAAVFFGREAAIVHGLDMLRVVRDGGIQHLVSILGASGAGKSSFLRAGLWPRLKRDDRRFLPLPVIRPERAALSGAHGLFECLDRAFREYGSHWAPKATQPCALTYEALDLAIEDLLELHMKKLVTPGVRPTVVLCIDQAEELFNGDGREEADRCLALLAHVLRGPAQAGTAQRPGNRCIAIFAIPTSRYEDMQTADSLKDIPQATFSLPPMDRAEFRSVIEGPATRMTAAGRKLSIDPELTARLLGEAFGADALPLLAFTIERLYLEYGATGTLTVKHYEALGGIQGSIRAAVGAALAYPDRAPAIPVKAAECRRLLRQGFIPWLAGIDPLTNEPRRRVARWDEIPVTSRGVVERLVSQRLLVRDRRKRADASDEADVVEVAHEALLRQWDMLTGWLDEDADALKAAEVVNRSAAEWRNYSGEAATDRLAHMGDRLVDAEALLQRPDMTRLLGENGIAYLRACREQADKIVREREEAQKRIAEEQEQVRIEQRNRGRAQRRFAVALVVFAFSLVCATVWVVIQRRMVSRETSSQLASAAAVAADAGYYDRAMRFALAGRDKGFLSPGTPDADEQLRRALNASMLATQLNGHQDYVTAVEFSDDGTRVLTTSLDQTVRVWNAATGEQITRIMHGEAVHQHSPDDSRLKSSREAFGDRAGIASAFFDHSAQHVLTAGQDGTVRIWEASTGKVSKKLDRGYYVRFTHAAFDRAGETAVILSGQQGGEIWNVSANTTLPFSFPDGALTYGAFNRDGSRFLATGPSASQASAGGVWNTHTGKLVAKFENTDTGFKSAAFSSDGQRILARLESGGVAILFDASTGKSIARFEGYDAALFPDGKRVVTAYRDAKNNHSLRMWDANTGHEIWTATTLDVAVTSLAISPSGRRVVTTDENGMAQVWDADADREMVPSVFEEAHPEAPGQDEARKARLKLRLVAQLMGHTRGLLAAAFAPDSEHLITGSDDFTARIWRIADGQTVARRFFGHQSAVAKVAFSPDSRRLFGVSMFSQLLIWNARDGALVGSLSTPVDSIAQGIFSADGTRAAVVSTQRSPVMDATSGKPTVDLDAHLDRIQGAAFSPMGDRIVTVEMEGRLNVFDASSGKRVLNCDGTGSALHVEFSPDGRNFLTAGPESAARLFDLTHCTPVLLYDEPQATGDKSDVLSAGFSANGSRVLTTYMDHSVRVWDASTGKPVSRLHFTSPFLPDNARLSPDGQRVVTWSEHYPDGQAIDPARIAHPQIWNATTGERWVDLKTETLIPTIVAPVFSKDGRFVAAGSGGDVVMWDTATGRKLEALNTRSGNVGAVAFSEDGKALAAGTSSDDIVNVWSVDWITRPNPNEVVEAACRDRILGANLVTAEDAALAWPLRDKIGQNICE